jgi:ketosteroid isomerase-like protein
MSTKHLFVKRRPPLRRRLLIWGMPLLLLTLIWQSLKSPKIDTGENIWTTPVEPPGAVVVTVNTVALQSQASATTPNQGQSQAPSVIADTNPTVQAQQAPDVPPQPVDENAALNEALNQWRQAWSAKNVPGYLGFYSPDFVPPKGLSRKTWEASRNERITSKEKIDIAIQNLRLQINDNTATAKFTQAYSDERLRMIDRKTLVWQKLNGRWLIQRETSE